MTKPAFIPRGPHKHDYDPVSGWCSHCLTRDDGLVIGYDGRTIRHPATRTTPPPSPELDW